MKYVGVNPDVWPMLSDEERRRAQQAVNEAYQAIFRPRPCACGGKPECPCPCHRMTPRSQDRNARVGVH